MAYLALFFILIIHPLFAKIDVSVSSTSAVLINSKTGKVLFDKNGSQKMYPASCTKIAFALYAIKYYQQHFNKRIKASQNALKALPESQKSKDNFGRAPSYILETDASHMGLKVGEEMSFYDLLEGSMVVSADDASNVLAEVMGNGSIDKCVEDVNRFIASLGISSTKFMNPHGLHHPEHVSTAHDLAKLSRIAMQDPLFQKLAKGTRFVRPKTNKQESVQLQSTNRLLVKGCKAYYSPCVGIKTGYHRRAGRCLVAAAEDKGRSLIAVLLQSPSREERFHDAKKLFQAAFLEQMITKTWLQAGPQSLSRTIEGATSAIDTYTKEAVSISYYPSEEPEVRCQLIWHEVSLPIKKGTCVGELRFIGDGELLQKVPLYATNDVKENFLHCWKKYMTWWTVVGLALLLGIGLYIFTRPSRSLRFR